MENIYLMTMHILIPMRNVNNWRWLRFNMRGFLHVYANGGKM